MKIKEVKLEAKQILNQNKVKGVLIVFCYMLVTYLLGLIPIIGSLVSLVITPALTVGILHSLMKFRNNEHVGYFDFLSLGFSKFGRAWGVAFRVFVECFVAVLVLILAMGAMAYITVANMLSGLGIIVGVVLEILAIFYLIMKTYKFRFSTNELIYTPDLKSKDIVKNSADKMKGNVGNALKLDFSFVGLFIVVYLLIIILAIPAALLGIVGSIVYLISIYFLMSYVVAYMMLAGILFYEKVSGLDNRNISAVNNELVNNELTYSPVNLVENHDDERLI